MPGDHGLPVYVQADKTGKAFHRFAGAGSAFHRPGQGGREHRLKHRRRIGIWKTHDILHGAVALAEKATHAVGGAQLAITGRSLGCVLAADAAVATGRPAVTLNAAGLNPESVISEGGQFFGGSVINYSVEGEILAELQSHPIAPGAFGTQYLIAPAAKDAGDSPIQLHYMTSVLDALGMPS